MQIFVSLSINIFMAACIIQDNIKVTPTLLNWIADKGGKYNYAKILRSKLQPVNDD